MGVVSADRNLNGKTTIETAGKDRWLSNVQRCLRKRKGLS